MSIQSDWQVPASRTVVLRLCPGCQNHLPPTEEFFRPDPRGGTLDAPALSRRCRQCLRGITKRGNTTSREVSASVAGKDHRHAIERILRERLTGIARQLAKLPPRVRERTAIWFAKEMGV